MTMLPDIDQNSFDEYEKERVRREMESRSQTFGLQSMFNDKLAEIGAWKDSVLQPAAQPPMFAEEPPPPPPPEPPPPEPEPEPPAPPPSSYAEPTPPPAPPVRRPEPAPTPAPQPSAGGDWKSQTFAAALRSVGQAGGDVRAFADEFGRRAVQAGDDHRALFGVALGAAGKAGADLKAFTDTYHPPEAPKPQPSSDYRMQVPASARASTPSPEVVGRGGDLRAYAQQAAQKAGIDPDIFVRQIQQESGFSTTAKSGAGAQGIAQIVPKYHPGVDTSDPYASLDYAANLMKSNLQKYGGDYSKALAAYNAGGGAVDKYGGVPPFAETQTYIKNILGGAKQAVGGAVQAVGARLPGAVGERVEQVGRDVSQFGDPQLTSEEAYAACGPAAAVRFASRMGRNPSLREALDLAKQVGWTAQQGMAGLGSQQQLMTKMGIETSLVPGAQWDRFAAEAQTGNPVTISTSAHYFYADGYNPQTGQFHVGRSGLDLKGGKEWMSRQEIEAAAQRLGGGTVQGALFANNPTVAAPSTTERGTFAAQQFDQGGFERAGPSLPDPAALARAGQQRIERDLGELEATRNRIGQGIQEFPGRIRSMIESPDEVGQPTSSYGNLGPNTVQRMNPESPGTGNPLYDFSGTLASGIGTGVQDVGRVGGALLNEVSAGTQGSRFWEGSPMGELRRDPEYRAALNELADATSAAAVDPTPSNHARIRQLESVMDARAAAINANMARTPGEMYERGMASPEREGAELVGNLLVGTAAAGLAPSGLASGARQFAASLALDPTGAPFQAAGELLGPAARAAQRLVGRGPAADIISRTGADVRPGLFEPGEAGTLHPREQLPNREVLEAADARYMDKEGEYAYAPPALNQTPITPETAALKGEDRIRQVIADLTPDTRFPRDLIDPDANKFAGELRRLGEGMATGDWTNEQTALASILTRLSQGRSQVPVSKLFSGLGEEWVARHMPSLQAQGAVPGGKAASYGMVVRPEVLATHIAGDVANPEMMQLLVALSRPALDELPAGSAPELASFATRAERDAVIDRGSKELFRLFAAGGQGGTRGDDVLMKGADIVRKYVDPETGEVTTKVSQARQPGETKGRQAWADTLPALHEKFLEWGQRTGRYAGLDDAARKDLLLEDIQNANVAGIGADKATFVPNMGFSPDYATLDLRMRRQVFGLSPKAKLTRAERNLLEQKLKDAFPEAEGGYVSQWLPWAYMTDEKTDYRSIPAAYRAVGDFMKNAQSEAAAAGRPLGELVGGLAQQTPRVPLEYGSQARVTTRVGVSPKVVKNLAPGTAGEDLYRAVPEIKAFARQAGVDYVEKPSIGTGLGFDPDGNPVLEPDANLVIEGAESANRWFAAAWLKANPDEASVMLAHTGPGVGEAATDSMGVMRLEAGAVDASALARATSEFSPYGWHMTTKLDRAGRASVTDIVVGGVEMDAAKFQPRFEEFRQALESEGFLVKSSTVEPARIEFLEQADVEGVLYGGPRGASRAAESEVGGLAGEVGGGGPVGYGAERRAFSGPDERPVSEWGSSVRGTGSDVDDLRGAAAFLARGAAPLRNDLVREGLVGGAAGGIQAAQEPGATPESVALGALGGSALGVGRAGLPRAISGRALPRIAQAIEEGGEAWRPQGKAWEQVPEGAALQRGVEYRLDPDTGQHFARVPDQFPRRGRANFKPIDAPPTAVGEPSTLPKGARPIDLSDTAEAERLRLDKFPEESQEEILNNAEAIDWARMQRRGVISDEAAEALADRYANSHHLDELFSKAKAGTAYNTEEMRAIRNASASQGVKVADLAEAIDQGDDSSKTLVEFWNETERLQNLIKMAEGGRTEWGRAGRAFADPVRLVNMEPTEAIGQITKFLGGDKDRLVSMIAKYREMVKSGADITQQAKFWAEVKNPPMKVTDFKDWLAWLDTVRYNSMLSGPRTGLINSGSFALFEMPWRATRDIAASVARGKPGELVPEAKGAILGMRRGSQAAMEAWMTGVSKEQALAGDVPQGLENRVRNPVGKGIAKLLSVPGRTWNAADQWAMAIAHDMTAGRFAAQIADREGLKGAAYQKRVAELMDDPTIMPALHKRATEAAERMVLKGEMGTFGSKIAGIGSVPGIGPLLMPFAKTSYHLLSRQIDRSPLGLLGTGMDVLSGQYAVRGKGNLGRALSGQGPRPKAATPLGERLGDNLMGTAAFIWFYDQAMQGNITGSGPSNPQEKELLRSQGWQPYSVKFGDRYVSYANTPMALPLSAAAAIAEVQRYGDPDADVIDMAVDGAKRFGEVTTEMTYLSSLSSIYKGLSDPERYGSQAINNLATSVVPYGSAINTWAQAEDPYARRVDKFNPGQAISARLPGLRETVPEALDVLGRETPNVRYGGGAINPLLVSEANKDPVLEEMRQLGITVGAQPREIDVNKIGLELTPDERRQLQASSGALAEQWLRERLADPEYQKLPASTRAIIAQRLIDRAREIARAQMLGQFGPDEIRRRRDEGVLREQVRPIGG